MSVSYNQYLELKRLNKLPVNQYAKVLLKKAKVDPQPDALYLL